MEKKFEEEEKSINANMLAMERRNQEMKDISRRLDALDALNLSGKLAAIETKLQYIQVLLEVKP